MTNTSKPKKKSVTNLRDIKNRHTSINTRNIPPHPLLAHILKASSKLFTTVFQKELDFVNKVYLMKDFIFKLNYSNHILISPPKNNIATYKYYVTRGNNGV